MERSWRKLTQLCRVDPNSPNWEGLPHLVNPRLTLRSLASEEGLAKEGFPVRLPRFNASSGPINAYRLSRRGSNLTWEEVRLESKLARRRRAEGHRVYTLYKRKADKVKPVDSDAKDGKVPGGRDDWYARAWAKKHPIADRNRDANNAYHKFIIPRTAEFERSKRLTLERAEALVVG